MVIMILIIIDFKKFMHVPDSKILQEPVKGVFLWSKANKKRSVGISNF